MMHHLVLLRNLLMLWSCHDTRFDTWASSAALTAPAPTCCQENRIDQQQLARRQALSKLSFAIFPHVFLFRDGGIANASDGISIEDIRSSLTPATAEQPQIPLTGLLSSSDSSLQVVEGLLYYKNPRSERRPIATDKILLTVRTSIDGPILAAARLPLTKIRLPLRFRMTERNVVRPELEEAWKRALREDDLLVQALVCPDLEETNGNGDAAATSSHELFCPSNKDGNRLEALSLAKLLRLQDGSVLRAPVSLPLG